MSPELAFVAPPFAMEAQFGIPAGACAATYSSPFASPGPSSLATAGAKFAFIHFCVGHCGWFFSPHANDFGPAAGAAGGEMFVVTGVGVGFAAAAAWPGG